MLNDITNKKISDLGCIREAVFLLCVSYALMQMIQHLRHLKNFQHMREFYKNFIL